VFGQFIPVLVSMVLFCGINTGCARREPQGPPTVILTDNYGKSVPVKVEIASRPSQQRRGLMFRQHLDPDAGMLFVYRADGPRYFWMKNTYLSLDMLFIGSNLRIVGIIEKAEPLTETKRSVDLPSRFILEVNGGFVRKHGVSIGSRVRFENIPGI